MTWDEIKWNDTMLCFMDCLKYNEWNRIMMKCTSISLHLPCDWLWEEIVKRESDEKEYEKRERDKK